jgi:AbrB family looped-hinge helix DNA binding protein
MALRKQSKITAKYQITIPKQVRELLKLQVADALVWQTGEDGRIYITAADAPIAEYKGAIRVGRGDIGEDIDKARDAMVDRFR